MYFIPVALFAKADAAWFGTLNDAPDVNGLTWSSFFAHNLLLVTLGNLVGGTLMVGAVYWLIYLRPSRHPPATDA